jgi:hypothetical protein
LIRTLIAILTLCATATTVAILEYSSTSRPDQLAVLTFAGLLGLAAGGLALRRWWGRWLGLAAGVTGTLYGGLAVASASLHHDYTFMLLAVPGPLLLACLSGRAMFERFDQPAGRTNDWRARLVRWAVITNLASLVTLGLIAYAAYDMRGFSDRVPNFPLMFGTVGVVIVGVLLLARGKTAGLLAAVLGIVAQVLMLFTLRRPAGLLLLGPGLTLAAASVVAYAAPMWRFLRPR